MMTVNRNNKKRSARLQIIIPGLLWAVLSAPLVAGASEPFASQPAASDAENQSATEPVSVAKSADLASKLVEVPAVEMAETAPVVEDKKTNLPVNSIFPEKDVPSSTTSLLSMLLGLFFVIALIVVVAWGVRRFSTLHASGGKHIKVLSATAIGARERLALVEVGDKRILIGVTPQQINTLHVFAKEDISDERETSDFARKLQEIMKKGKVQ